MDALEQEILVVEDHEDSATCLARLLEVEGFKNVDVAHDAEQAIRMARQWRYDVALCDIGLPDMDGCDLLKELMTEWPVKGIAVTGHGMPSDIDRIRKSGFSGHVLKPCTIDSIISAIRNAVNPPSEQEAFFRASRPWSRTSSSPDSCLR